MIWEMENVIQNSLFGTKVDTNSHLKIQMYSKYYMSGQNKHSFTFYTGNSFEIGLWISEINLSEPLLSFLWSWIPLVLYDFM